MSRGFSQFEKNSKELRMMSRARKEQKFMMRAAREARPRLRRERPRRAGDGRGALRARLRDAGAAVHRVEVLKRKRKSEKVKSKERT